MMSLFPDRDPTPQEGSDVAYTPAEACEAIARTYFHGRPRGLIWEPCAGGGAWLPALRRYGPVVATELDPAAASVVSGDATQWNALRGPPPGVEPRWIVTNPPFSCAAALLRRWLEIPSVEGIGLLLLQGWSVPKGEDEEYRRDLCFGPVARIRHKLDLYPRISFEGPGRKPGNDNREYSFYEWRKLPEWRHKSPMTFDLLEWR